MAFIHKVFAYYSFAHILDLFIDKNGGKRNVEGEKLFFAHMLAYEIRLLFCVNKNHWLY